jgi:drug/metabolite transporter (DMT)-like permease
VRVTQGAQFVAIADQPEATTSLILSLTPLVVAAVSTTILRERPSRAQIVGAVVVAIGAGMYFTGSLGVTAEGTAAAVVSLRANAASALMGRRINRDREISPLVVTAVSMTLGSVVLLTAGAVTEQVGH